MNHSTRQPARWVRTALAAIAAPVLFATLVAGTPDPGVQECTLTFTPATVSAGAEMMNLTYSASEQVEGITGVAFEDDSGLSGALGDEPMQIQIDPAGATAGEWAVTLLAGTSDACGGLLTVTG